MNKISDLQSRGIVPITYPNKCECGCDLYTNTEMTLTLCLNERCFVTLSQKLLQVINTLQIKQLGVRWCEEITKSELLRTEGNITHMDIFVNRLTYDEPITLSTYLQLWCLPNLGSSNSNSIASKCKSIDDLYEKLNYDFLGNCLNISATSITVVRLYKMLKLNENNIKQISNYFNIIKKSGKSLVVCITGEIKGFKPRDKFASYLSYKYGVDVIVSSTLTRKVDYLICNSLSGTSKENKARNYNIPIITQEEMEEILSGQ